MQETQPFTVDRNILFSVMERQAGTIAKAMLEAVMNSVDAGATRAVVKLDAKTLSVRDDGRGFQSREEIIKWFGCFGTPHQEGDAVFGQFRMGRGQLMSFGVNEWRTGSFRMDVDLKNKGLDYALTAGLNQVKGCTVHVQLYQELSESELAQAISEFSQLIRFSPIPVSLNGRPASEALDKVKWDSVDDDAYIRLDKSSELKVYNLGVLVRSYPRYRFGCSGVVVSRKRLMVNFARNDIMVHECEVWLRIAAKLKQQSMLKVAAKSALNDDDRQFLAHEIAYGAGRKTLGDLAKRLKILTTVDGKAVALQDLFAARCVTVAEDEQSNLGAKLQREGKALVLNKSSLARFGAYDIQDLLDRVEAENLFGRLPRVQSFAKLARNQVEEHITDNEDGLPFWESCLLDVLRETTPDFVAWLRKMEPNLSGPRKVYAGHSNVAQAWTDGSTQVVFSHKLLKKARTKKLPGMMEVFTVLVHEYCHDDADLESHDHDQVFYRKFHDLMLYGGTELARIAQAASKAYQRRLKDYKAQAKEGLEEAARSLPTSSSHEMSQGDNWLPMAASPIAG